MSDLPPYFVKDRHGLSESRPLVCGGRDYEDRNSVFQALDTFYVNNPNIAIIHGACTDPITGKLTGADKWAEEWAIDKEVPYIGVPARWHSGIGKVAGPVRIKYMFDRFAPTSVIAFPGGPGTAATMREANARRIIVWEPFGPGLAAKAAIHRRSIG